MSNLQPHPAASMFPMLDRPSLDALKADIQKNGQQLEIFLLDGLILDGRNRYVACLELDLEPWTAELDPEQVDDPVAMVLSLNAHRRHLTTAQKREIIANALKLEPEKSDRRHAKALGVSDKTVGAVRAEKIASAEIPHVEVAVDTKGRQQPRSKVKPKAKPLEPPQVDDLDDETDTQQTGVISEAKDLYARCTPAERLMIMELWKDWNDQ